MRCTIILLHYVGSSEHHFRLSQRRSGATRLLPLHSSGRRIYGLLGRNGAGKSTLLYLMAGLLTPAKGRVCFNGVNTRERKPYTMSDIFIVPEEFMLPSVSLREYLKLNSHFYPRFSEEDLVRHLDTFDLTPDLNLGALSMGQKKKGFHVLRAGMQHSPSST